MVYSTQKKQGKKVLVLMSGLVARRQDESAPFREAGGSGTGMTPNEDIPLPDPVTVIDTACNTLYPLKNGKLMVAEKGVFFEAARMTPFTISLN